MHIAAVFTFTIKTFSPIVRPKHVWLCYQLLFHSMSSFIKAIYGPRHKATFYPIWSITHLLVPDGLFNGGLNSSSLCCSIAGRNHSNWLISLDSEVLHHLFLTQFLHSLFKFVNHWSTVLCTVSITILPDWLQKSLE